MEEHMKTLFVRFVRNDEGQDLIEYAMLGTVIALTVYAGASTMATSLKGWYEALGTKVDGWAASL
jgi:Flp pilus assembly pilin Flp